MVQSIYFLLLSVVASSFSVEWVPCPLLTNQGRPKKFTNGKDRAAHEVQQLFAHMRFPWKSPVVLPDMQLGNFSVECALVQAPLDHSSPAEHIEIDLFVKRLRPTAHTTNAVTHALWLLAGGPGDSSADDVEPLHALLASRLPLGAFEVYITDHRGVGRSTRLGCRRSQAETPGSLGGIEILVQEYPGCLADLKLDFPDDGSHFFSTTTAAHDLNFLIEGLRRPGQRVSIYSVSYGTYWAGRYARIYPSKANAIVFDGVVSASGATSQQRLTFDTWDLKLNLVGLDVLRRCGQDDFCKSKLGVNPGERAKELLHQLEDTMHCAKSLEAIGGLSSLRKVLGLLLYKWHLRGTITALLYRLARCSAEDQQALNHFASAKSRLVSVPLAEQLDLPASGAPLRSEVLFRNIALSELWDPTTTRTDQIRWFNKSMFAMDIFSDLPDLYQIWPVYSPDKYFNTTLSTDAHLLFMNGDTDAQTPLWSAKWEFERTATTGSKEMIVWPDATHFSVFNTPTVDGGDPCGLQAVVAFLTSPAAGDLEKLPCRQRMRNIDFAGDSEMNTALWGHADAYENGMQTNMLNFV